MKNIVVLKETFLFIPIAIFFACISSLRGDTPDTYNYKIIYENIYNYSLIPSKFYEQTYMEVGYGYLAIISKTLNLDFRFFLFLYSLLIFIFIKKTANNFGINSFYSILCYLSTFYVYHQWMQLRQGLAVVLAFYFVSLIYNNKSFLKSCIYYGFAIISHNVVIPFGIIFLFYIKKTRSIYENNNFSFFLKLFFCFILVLVACRLVSFFAISQLDRVQTYAVLEESRSLLHPANLRGYILLLLFLIFRIKNNNALNILLVLYATGIAIRIGFYDFLILSGRLSTVFTFAEIFIIPIILLAKFNKILAISLLFLYVFISGYLTANIQLPDILNQYFQPLP